MSNKVMKVSTSLLLLFIGELFITISLLKHLVVFVPAFQYSTYLALGGSIVSLVGIISLRKENSHFHRAFTFILTNIVLTIAMVILSYIPLTGDAVTLVSTVLRIGNIVVSVLTLLITIDIISGCAEAVNGDSYDPYARRMINIYLSSKIIAILIDLLIILINNVTATNILSIIGIIISVFAEVFYLIYLFKAYRASK